MNDKDIILDDFKNITISKTILPIIVIYNKPLDYPNKIVARLWHNDNPTRYIMLKDDIVEIRERIPVYMTKLLPFPDDDKIIIETWL